MSHSFDVPYSYQIIYHINVDGMLSSNTGQVTDYMI